MARQSLSPMTAVDYEATQELLNKSQMQKLGRNKITHLKYLRKKSGYTLETLSEVTKISVSYLSRLESGSRRLNTDLIRRLSIAFQCDPAELLQEVSHDCSVIAPVEFKKKAFRFNEPKEVRVFTIENAQLEETDQTEYLPKNISSFDDIFAIKFEEEFNGRKIIKKIFVSQSETLTPGKQVFILNNNKELKELLVWSITPRGIQLCDDQYYKDVLEGKGTDKGNIIDVSTDEQIYTIKAIQCEF